MSAWENYHLEWSADPLSVTTPTWQDITAYALAPFGSPISITGGVPTMGSSAQSTVMSVSLDNTDHRFTFGNTASPLSPNWKPGRRIRCYETIAGRRFDLFTGYIQPPQTDDWADRGVDQYMSVTAIDRLGRIGQGRTFVSTLTEHIRYASAATLLAYWTLGEAIGPFYRPLVNPGAFPTLTELDITSSATGATQSLNLYAAAAGSPLPGDDLAPPKFAPQLVGTPAVAYAETQLRASITPNISAATNSTITVATWVWPDPACPDGAWEPIRIYFGWNAGAGTGLLRLRRTDSTETPGQVWKGSFRDDSAGFIAEAFGTWTPANPTLLAVHINLTANTIALYVNGVQYPGTVTGTLPSTFTFVQIAIGSTFIGGLNHVQIHQSTATADHDLTAHTAQYNVGVAGLRGQTTGQRITTLMQYAGVPATDVGLIDTGVALMQKVSLAGKNPLTAMREAETTEQGRLRTNGQGLPVFDPRTRRYAS